MKKYLIVYYSRTGATKKAAKELYRLLGQDDADIEEIIDLKDRKGVLGWLVSGKDALSNHITKIEALKHQPSDYFNVIIATPIWCGKMADAIRTYIATYKSDIKSLILITCAAGQTGETVQKDIFRRFALKSNMLISLKEKEVRKGSVAPHFECILGSVNVEKGEADETHM